MNKEIAKIMLKTVSKYTAISIGLIAFTIGFNHLIQWLFGVNSMEAAIVVLLASIVFIGIWAAYDDAKFKIQMREIRK